MQSLLGQFYSRIKGSQEDIASLGLTYILQKSRFARIALYKIIKSECEIDFDDLSFSTQNIGEKLERPDISAFNIDGKEVLIIEAKFWASLTDNQPIEYLNRLKQDNSVLIFICPTLRVIPVFDELIKRVRSSNFIFRENSTSHTITFHGNKHLIVKTWDEILNTIKLHLVQNNEQVLISDIDQIIGFCNTIDSNAFLPFQDDDFSPKYAKRIISFYDLLDKVTEKLKKQNIADTLNLKATPQKVGYTRYFRTKKFGVSLNIMFDYWGSYADTPFWINFKHLNSASSWTTTDEIRKKCKQVSSQLGFKLVESNNRDTYIALFPVLNKTEDIVIQDLVFQILNLITTLEID